MPQPHQLSFTKNVLNVKHRNHKLISWLYSTTFIVSPVLADAFDFRVEQDALGQVLHIERFEDKRRRPDSPEAVSRSKSFSLNKSATVEHEGLTLKLERDEPSATIRVRLYKKQESLGYFEVKDDGRQYTFQLKQHPIIYSLPLQKIFT